MIPAAIKLMLSKNSPHQAAEIKDGHLWATDSIRAVRCYLNGQLDHVAPGVYEAAPLRPKVPAWTPSTKTMPGYAIWTSSTPKYWTECSSNRLRAIPGTWAMLDADHMYRARVTSAHPTERWWNVVLEDTGHEDWQEAAECPKPIYFDPEQLDFLPPDVTVKVGWSDPSGILRFFWTDDNAIEHEAIVALRSQPR